MKKVFGTLVVLALIGAGILTYIYFGGYNVAATDPHSAPVAWFLNHTTGNAISRMAEGVKSPALDDQAMIREGAAEYHEMCETCHGGPGVEASAIGHGLYPEPPELIESAREMPPEQIFWVIKHGIKMTGMPAFGKTHGDEELWTVTAFVSDLPRLSSGDYREMISSGHEHGEAEPGEAEPGEEGGPSEETTSR